MSDTIKKNLSLVNGDSLFFVGALSNVCQVVEGRAHRQKAYSRRLTCVLAAACLYYIPPITYIIFTVTRAINPKG
jgi:hypothetical protein